MGIPVGSSVRLGRHVVFSLRVISVSFPFILYFFLEFLTMDVPVAANVLGTIGAVSTPIVALKVD